MLPELPVPMPTGAGRVDRLRGAAAELGSHPQDHGWRELYRLIADATPEGAPGLWRLLADAAAVRPDSGDTHLVTLVGIAIKAVCPSRMVDLAGSTCVQYRIALLDAIASDHQKALQALIATRQNSFTGTRRFLVPHVLLAAISSQLPQDTGLRWCDLGTGLGILPYQLNSPELYTRFAGDLRWPQGIPAYRPIRLEARFGIDRRPLPDLDWVASCYGSSSYYRGKFAELLETVEYVRTQPSLVEFAELDLLDADTLGRFITGHRINAVNLSYTLYELSPHHRAQVLDTLSASLAPPGVLTVTEPERDLSAQGCSVSVTETATGRYWRVVRVSDGHFIGQVTPLEDFDAFTREFPIPIVHC